MALIDNLVAYYKLDETSGNAIDIHGSNDGTTTNISYEVTGKINTGYSFNGVPIGNTLSVTDNERGIEGELLFDSQGYVLQANHKGRDGISGDVPIKSWKDCYLKSIKEIMSLEDRMTYFHRKFRPRVTPLLGGMLLVDNEIILGEEEIDDFEDDW